MNSQILTKKKNFIDQKMVSKLYLFIQKKNFLMRLFLLKKKYLFCQKR